MCNVQTFEKYAQNIESDIFIGQEIGPGQDCDKD